MNAKTKSHTIDQALPKIVAVYQLETGKIHREQITPAEAVELIRTGRYHDQTIKRAEIYNTRGRLKGERRNDNNTTLPEEYRHWWHDDDLNQIELDIDHHNCDIPR